MNPPQGPLLTVDVITSTLWTDSLHTRRSIPWLKRHAEDTPTAEQQAAPIFVGEQIPGNQPRPTPSRRQLHQETTPLLALPDVASIQAGLTHQTVSRASPARRPIVADYTVIVDTVVGPVWIGSLDESAKKRPLLASYHLSSNEPLPNPDLTVTPIYTAAIQQHPVWRQPAKSTRIPQEDAIATVAPAAVVPKIPSLEADPPPRRMVKVIRSIAGEGETPLYGAVILSIDRLGPALAPEANPTRRTTPRRVVSPEDAPPLLVDTLNAPVMIGAWGIQHFPKRTASPPRPAQPTTLDLTQAEAAQWWPVDEPERHRFQKPWVYFAQPESEPPWIAAGTGPGPVGPGIIIVPGPYWVAGACMFFAGAIEGDVQEV